MTFVASDLEGERESGLTLWRTPFVCLGGETIVDPALPGGMENRGGREGGRGLCKVLRFSQTTESRFINN